MPNLIHGQDPGGGLRPIQVDDNGNLSIDIVSGVSVSTEFASGAQINTLQASGSIDSINILQVGGTAVATDSGVTGAGVIRTVHVTDVAVSVRAIANSGVDIGDVDILSIAAGDNNIGNVDIVTMPSVTIGTFPDNEPFNISQINGNTVKDGSGVDGTGVFRVVHVTDVALSSQASGVAAHDSPVSGNPVLGGGEARTTNPTAVADGDAVRSIHDDLGRQVITPYQVRDLVTTAYLSLTTGTETAVQAGVASTLLDLVQVVCANQSDAAVDVDFRFGTGGSVSLSLTIPADSTSGFIPAVPIPMPEVAQAFTADMADITGTTINITATFIRNV